MFQGDGTKIDQTLERLLQYQTDKKFDPDDILIALCLFNLAEMMQLLPRGRAKGSDGETTALAAPGDLQSLLTPFINLITTAAGQGNQAPGQQAPFNPAHLLSLLGTLGGASGGKGGAMDFTSLLGLLGPLLAPGGQGGITGPSPGEMANKKTGTHGPVRPIQREINLDQKIKDIKTKNKQKQDTLPKPGEVLEWKFK